MRFYSDRAILVDIRTSGLDADEHNIVHLVMLVCDSYLERVDSIPPLNLFIRARTWHHGARQAAANILPFCDVGMSTEDAGKQVFHWFMTHLKGEPAIPVAHDWANVSRWLLSDFGPSMLSEMFIHGAIDTKATAFYLSMRHYLSFWPPPMPFSRLSLGAVARELNVWAEWYDSTNSLQRVRMVQRVARALLRLDVPKTHVHDIPDKPVLGQEGS